MRRNTAKALTDMVLAHRPAWTRRQAAEWLKPRLGWLRRRLRNAARDAVTEAMIEQDILDSEKTSV